MIIIRSIKITSFFKSFSNPAKKVPFFVNVSGLLIFYFKVKHDFLKHYHGRENMSFQDKPLEIVRTDNILKYEVSVNKHSDYYNFEDAEQVVDDFLKNVRLKFKPRGDALLKCGFLIENIQQPL